MSRRDTAAAILIATAAAGVFALSARGQEIAAGPDPYFQSAVELTGEIVAVEDQRFTLKDDQGRDFQIRAEGLRDIPRADNGDLDLDTGERVTVRGDSGSPMLNVNMVAATRVETS
ncbi:MAG: hypothetical protein ACOC0V_04415 [Oceanicaulis sp.]